jgi:hypothetical protein
MNELMVHVERAVRPIRASSRRKDRMREELLAHLTTLYQEELARLGDERAAREQAFLRFGNPADLTRELQDSVSFAERVAFVLERWVGWRAPETAARWMFRLAIQMFLLSAVLSALVSANLKGLDGPGPNLAARLRLWAAFLVVAHADVFFLGVLYFKMRDALCGGLGMRRSWPRAAGFGGLSALVVLASGLGFTLLGLGGVPVSLELLPLWFPFALLAPLCSAVGGLVYGPAEIRHTEWACLDIGQ